MLLNFGVLTSCQRAVGVLAAVLFSIAAIDASRLTYQGVGEPPIQLTIEVVDRRTCYNGPEIASESLSLELTLRNASNGSVSIRTDSVFIGRLGLTPSEPAEDTAPFAMEFDRFPTSLEVSPEWSEVLLYPGEAFLARQGVAFPVRRPGLELPPSIVVRQGEYDLTVDVAMILSRDSPRGASPESLRLTSDRVPVTIGPVVTLELCGQ